MVKLKVNVDSVIIGNFNVVDVVVYDDMFLFVIGKLFGIINLMIFDKDGNMLYLFDVVVMVNMNIWVSVKCVGVNYIYDCVFLCCLIFVVGDE